MALQVAAAPLCGRMLSERRGLSTHTNITVFTIHRHWQIQTWANRAATPIDQKKGLVMAVRSSLPRTWGQAIIYILKFWPLFCLDKKLSASVAPDPPPVALPLDHVGVLSPDPVIGKHYVLAMFCPLWQILDSPLTTGLNDMHHSHSANWLQATLTRCNRHQSINQSINHSLNQSKQIYIAPCVASESEARDGRD